MAIEVELDMAAIAGIETAAKAAALETVRVLRGEVVSAAVMPFDTGHMQNNQTEVTQVVDGEEIHTMLTTDAPQARRLYYHPEYHFQTGKNANAGASWLADWLPGGAQESFLPDTFTACLKEKMPK
ncbi:MAG: hypothetical protein LKJ90_07080 [Faecalibacterium sp.]|jgi:hypothetical protein|nr:hypothetical protein [Faecalibacterium sp.]